MSACPIKDRVAIEDLAIAYCSAVDRIGDAGGVASLFAENAVYDLQALGLGKKEGRDAIRAFFDEAFKSMAYNAHFLTNFRLLDFAGDEAKAAAYVHGFSRSVDGIVLEVKASYAFEVARTAEGWRFGRLAVSMLMPMAG